MEDSMIISLFFERSEEAIERLSEKYGSLCMSISKNILKSEDDAQECVNDAYLGVWNAIPPEKPNPLSAYVCRIVRNISIARYHRNTAQRRNSHYDAALDELAECIPSPDTKSVRELTEALNGFLAALSIENRVIFLRRYWFGDSIEAVAKRTKITENNVYVRLSRIRDRLREYLGKEGFNI